MWGMLIGTAICVVPIAFVTLRSAFTKGAAMWFKEGLQSGLLHLPSSGANVLRTQTERLLTVGMLGEAALARYSVGSSVGYGIYFVSGALLSALTPWSMRKMAKNATRVVGEVSDLCCDLIFSGAMIISAVAPEVIAFLAPSYYRDGVYIALPIALAAVPTYLCSVMTAELEYFGKRREAISVTLGASAIGIFASLVSLRVLGIFGAGIGTLVTASAQYIMLTFRTRITSGLKRGLICILGGCVLGGLIVVFYSSLPVRIMLMIPPALIATHTLIKAKGYVREI
jgi:O-antigen/teichoic acid export membrane protein